MRYGLVGQGSPMVLVLKTNNEIMKHNNIVNYKPDNNGYMDISSGRTTSPGPVKGRHMLKPQVTSLRCKVSLIDSLLALCSLLITRKIMLISPNKTARFKLIWSFLYNCWPFVAVL